MKIRNAILLFCLWCYRRKCSKAGSEDGQAAATAIMKSIKTGEQPARAVMAINALLDNNNQQSVK